MPVDTHARLLGSGQEPEAFVRSSLRLLERELREMALWALADFDRSGLVAPVLFDALASLQRPSWGTWNGLIVGLRSAKRAVLRAGHAAERAKLDDCATLERALAAYDATASFDVAEAVRSLAALLGIEPGSKIRLSAAFTVPIALRNAIEHGRAPEPSVEPDWWARVAAALRGLHGAAADGRVYPRPLGDATWGAPWLLVEREEVWSFNGLADDGVVVYVTRDGATRRKPESTRDVLLALRRLMGKADVEEQDFRKLMARLAPEDVKGVILGDYLVGPPVGSGGFATVHLGRQLSTVRKVAIKLLNDGLGQDERLRLRQEASFLSQFHHPHIVSVIDSGQEVWHASRKFNLADETWYREFAQTAPVKTFIVLEWIDGETLDRVFGRLHGPDRDSSADRPSTSLLTHWFADAAEALTVVHAAQLVHRDVKPGNLMVTREGQIKLMDFGVARSLGELNTIQTTTGRVPGTPAYMSPEQIRASQAEAEVGPATDIYSLCATFYELFTGRRLYDHDVESAESVRSRKLAGTRPVRPRLITRGLPWEIESILLGGLETEAGDRYRSMAALRRDLEHVQRDEPIEYKRPSLARRFHLAYRRHRIVANLVAVFLVLAAAGIARYIWALRAEQQQTLAQKNIAITRLDHQYVLNGQRAMDADDLLSALPWFVEAARMNESKQPATVADRLRGEAHQVRLGMMFRQAPRPVKAWFEARAILAFSPDGQFLAATGGEYEAVLLDLRSGRSVALMHADPVLRAAFSPDGKRLITAAGDNSGRNGKGAARVWEVPSGRPVTPWLEHEGNPRPAQRQAPTDYIITNAGVILDARFSPDGHRVATAADSNTVRVWEAATGRMVGSSLVHRRKVHSVVFSPDGTSLLASCGDNKAHLWNIETGRERLPAFDHDALAAPASFSPDGRRILVIQQGAAQAVDLNPPNVQTSIKDGGKVTWAAFDSSGQRVGVVSDDETGRVWSLVENHWITPRLGHRGLLTLSFSPDGRDLLTSGQGVRIWDSDTGASLSPLLSQAQGAAAWSSAGPYFATTTGGALTLWALPPRRFEAIGPAGRHSTAVSPRLGRLATFGEREDDPTLVRLWSAGAVPVPLATLKHAHPVRSVIFSDDGEWAIVAAGVYEGDRPSKQGEVRLWSAETGAARGTAFVHPACVERGILSPDRQTLATITSEGRLFVWDVATGQAIGPLPTSTHPVLDVAFTPDSGRLIVARGTERPHAGEVQVWEVANRRLAYPPLAHQGYVTRAVVSPDGHGLLTVTRSWPRAEISRQVLQLWDLTRGVALTQPVEGGLPIDEYVKPPRQARVFSPDGRLVLVAGRLLSATTGQEVFKLRAAGRLSFSDDGRRILSVNDAGAAARIWDATTGEPITPPIDQGAFSTMAELDPEARLLLTVKEHRASGVPAWIELRAWDASTGEALSPPLPVRSRYQGQPRDLRIDGKNHVALLIFADSPTWRLDLGAHGLPLEALAARAELLSGQRLDTTGGLVPVVFREAWNAATRPSQSAFDPDSSARWQRQEAFEAVAAFDRFATAWNLDRTLATMPDQGDLLALRAEAKLELGDPKQAVADATRAIQLGHDTRRVRQSRARAHAALGDWNAALADCQAIPPDDDRDFTLLRTTVYAELGQVAHAGQLLMQLYRGYLSGNDEMDIRNHVLPEHSRGGHRGLVILVATLLGRDVTFGAEGRDYLQAALTPIEAQFKQDPKNQYARRYRILGRIGLAEHHTAGKRRNEAQALLEEATTLAKELDLGSADDRYVLERLADAWQSLGDDAAEADEDALAQEAYEASNEWYKTLSAATPDDKPTLQELASTYVALSRRRIKANQPQEASALLEQAQKIWDRLVADSPNDRVCLQGQGYVIGMEAYAVQLQGKLDEARRLILRARSIAERVAALLEQEKPTLSENSYMLDYHDVQERLSFLCKRQAYLASELRDLKAARAYREEAAALDDRLLDIPPFGSDEFDTAFQSHLELAQACAALEDWTAVRAQYRKAIELKQTRSYYAKSPFRLHADLAELHRVLSRVARKLEDPKGTHDELAAVLRELEEAVTQASSDADRAEANADLGWFLATIDDDRLRNATRALDCAKKACELTHLEDLYALDVLATAHAASGDFAEAAKWCRKSIEKAEAAQDRRAPVFRKRLRAFEANQAIRIP